MFVSMLKRNKRVNGNFKLPSIIFIFLESQQSDIVTAIEKKDGDEQTDDTVRAINVDEYAQILHDLDLMAEEKIRTLMENSLRETQPSVSMISCRQLEAIPEQSMHN